MRFRCHIGHAYSLQALLAEFNERTEESLWSAIRSIEETALLLGRMAAQLTQHQHKEAAEALEQRAREVQKRADFICQAWMQHEKPSNEGVALAVDTS